MKLKPYPIIFFFSFAFLSGLSSDEKSIIERVEFLEEKRGYEFKKKKFQGIAEGEFLYWKADIDGVACATTSITEQVLGGVGSLNSNVKTLTPHFHYDPGFRIGLGVQSPYDLFDVFFVWTRFYTQGHDHTSGSLVAGIPAVGDQLVFDGIGLIQQLVSIPNFASVKCRIKENVLDMQLARGIEVSRHFFMRPYFGVRGVWSSIVWDIDATRDFIIPGIFNQDSTELKVDNNFHAVGGLIGLELDWKMPLGFGFNARGAGALVWGITEEKTKQKYFLLPADTATVFEENFRAENSSHSVKGFWELFAGMFWETHLFRKKVHERELSAFNKHERKQHVTFRLFAGYEFQQWPNLGQKTNTQVTRQRERFSLGFNGFTGGAKLVF